MYDFAARPKAYFVAEELDVKPPDPGETTMRDAAHHVIVVDRSGSMWGEMKSLKNTLLKLLTLQEYRDKALKVSLISYSGVRDLTLHFEKVDVADIMEMDSPYQKEIKSIRVTGLTCISQAMQMAEGLVEDGELTCITLHTDGYANDHSPRDERRKLREICNRLKERNCFLNTIAYSRYSDFPLMAELANMVSGSCVKAQSAADVYDSLYQTSSLLAQSAPPTLVFPDGNDFEQQVYVEWGGRKVIGSNGELVIRGVDSCGDVKLYRYQEVSQKEYEYSDAFDCLTGWTDDIFPILAFVRYCIASGQLNRAKFLLFSTLNMTLSDRHAAALDSERIAAFATDVDAALFDNSMPDNHIFADEMAPSDMVSILELAELLSEYSDAIEINKEALFEVYNKRSVKRVPGKIDPLGKYIPPRFKLRPKNSSDEYFSIRGVECNESSATINLLFSYEADLVEQDAGENIVGVVEEVSSVRLNNLRDYRNYTLVGDGLLAVPHLQVRFRSKKAFAALERAGLVDGPWNPSEDYILDLEHLPLVDFQDASFDSLSGEFERMAKLKMLAKMLEAALKGQSDLYTPEQIAALDSHHLKPSLFYSGPSIYKYVKDGLTREAALSQGVLDTRVKHKVLFGTEDTLSLDKIPSANAFLRAYFTVTDAKGQLVDKPTVQDALAPNAMVGWKVLSSRKKVTRLDDMLKPLAASFFGIDTPYEVLSVLRSSSLNHLTDDFEDFSNRDESTILDDLVEFLTQMKRDVKGVIDRVYRDKICPIVFYIGATGLLPDNYDVPAMGKVELGEVCPNIKTGKKEEDAIFFKVDDVLLTVYTEVAEFSREQAASN